jgi:hypothetical protein
VDPGLKVRSLQPSCFFWRASFWGKTSHLSRCYILAAAAANECMRLMFEHDVFLQPEIAERIAEAGLKFLRRWAWLAKEAVARSLSQYLLIPKLHAFHHLMLSDLLLPARKGHLAVNPATYGVQQDEDFTGKASRLSRRVSPKTVCLRVIERHLQATCGLKTKLSTCAHACAQRQPVAGSIGVQLEEKAGPTSRNGRPQTASTSHPNKSKPLSPCSAKPHPNHLKPAG